MNLVDRLGQDRARAPRDLSTDFMQANRLMLLLLYFVLRPRLTSKVMSGRSVNLTTLFLGRLRPHMRLTSTSCTYFRQ